MGSPINSSHTIIRERTNGESPLSNSTITVHEAPEAPSTGSYGLEELGAAFAKPGGYISKDIERLWPAVPTHELDDYQVLLAPHYLPRPPMPRIPVPEIAELYAAEAPLRRLLALASAVGLPRQIEREEANMVRCPQKPSLVTQGSVATLSVLGNRADGGEPVFGSDVEEHVPAGPAK